MAWRDVLTHTFTQETQVFFQHLFYVYNPGYALRITVSAPATIKSRGSDYPVLPEEPFEGKINPMALIVPDTPETSVTLQVGIPEEKYESYQELLRVYDPYTFRVFHMRAMVPLPETMNLYDNYFVPYDPHVFQPCFYLDGNPALRVVRSRNTYYCNKNYLSIQDRHLHYITTQDTNLQVVQKVLQERRYQVKKPETLTQIEEPVFYFNYHINNYLHFLRDTIPYLFWFLRLKKDFPDLKLLQPQLSAGVIMHPFYWEILRAFGLQKQDVMVVDGPLLNSACFSNFFQVESSHLVTQVPQLWMNPQVFSIYQELGDQIKGLPSLYRNSAMLYISRRTWTRDEKQLTKIGQNNTTNRKLENEDELVDLFRKYGIIEIFAEDYDFVHKIQLFNSSPHIFTTFGAGIMTGVFTRGTRYTVLNSLSYSMDKIIQGKIAENNEITSYSYFLKDRERHKNCPWKIDLERVEKLLTEELGLEPLGA